VPGEHELPSGEREALDLLERGVRWYRESTRVRDEVDQRRSGVGQCSLAGRTYVRGLLDPFPVQPDRPGHRPKSGHFTSVPHGWYPSLDLQLAVLVGARSTVNLFSAASVVPPVDRMTPGGGPAAHGSGGS
jgi:hypothetical protein